MPYVVEYFSRDVLAVIERWPVDVLAAYARSMELLMEIGPQIGMPYSRALGGGLFELRPHAREGAGRALYCWASDRRVIVLHAFVTKTRRTPPAELALARLRLREVRCG
jgi:phage-related protein